MIRQMPIISHTHTKKMQLSNSFGLVLTSILLKRFANDIETDLTNFFNIITMKVRNSSACIYRAILNTVLFYSFSASLICSVSNHLIQIFLV